MKAVLLSDTHGKHEQIKIPSGDLFIHAGDFTMAGEIETVASFNRWLGELPFPRERRLVLAGNHDLGFERSPSVFEPMLTNCVYVRDSGGTIDGRSYWGSPWTPFYRSELWVFHKRGYDAMYEHWKKIPEGLDILITHGPPNRVLDLTRENQYAGDAALLVRLNEMQVRPRMHVFGHIHESGGQMREAYGSQVFNACVLDRAFNIAHQPFVVEI